jgi:LysM repeat protein
MKQDKIIKYKGMKIIRLIKTLPVIIILFAVNYCLCSQVLVERSKDKVIISGVPYYVHTVKKGETAYSISRAYGITVEELDKENPPAIYGVKEGQGLRIPIRPAVETKSIETATVIKAHDDSKFIYHNLKPGETVYRLSKMYGVSENEIIQSNAGIDINKLPVGAEIAVPKRQFMSDRQKFDDQDKRYIYHKVLEGETLSSIAREYGLSVRELRRENRDLRFPQVGDFVRIPSNKVADYKEIEPIIADTIPEIIEEPVIKPVRPAGFTEVKNLRGSLNVAVLLPFYLKENAERVEVDSSRGKSRKQFKFNKRSEDWIYFPSLDFVEMYEGILLAADTLRSLGLDVNIYPFDIRRDTVALTRLINSGRLEKMDLIIGPVYSHNLTIVADYTRNLGIPVVSPVPLINDSALQGNPNLFMSHSSLEVVQKALSKKICEYYDYNFVFIHTDTLGTDEEIRRFKNMIFTELSHKLPYEETKFKELIFYSRSMFDNDSINRLSHALSDHSRNIVIIASEDPPVVSESIMDVHGLSRKFDVRVFGYPAMRDLENLDPKYFFDLDMMVYSPSWIDYTKPDVMQFNSKFRQKFLTEPSEKSYAWQGYDIAYYFLSGLSMNGKNFISSPETHNPDLLQTEYDFIRKNTGDGYENQKLHLIRYTKEYDVMVVEEKPSYQQ